MAHQVRAGVADDLQPFRVLGGDDAQRGVVVDAVAGIDELSVDLTGNRRLGEARLLRMNGQYANKDVVTLGSDEWMVFSTSYGGYAFKK